MGNVPLAFVVCGLIFSKFFSKTYFRPPLADAGSIAFETLDVGSALTLSAKNGDISGAVAGSYDDFSIQTELKKGESSLPGDKDDGEKALRVSCNNGDVDIAFANGN